MHPVHKFVSGAALCACLCWTSGCGYLVDLDGAQPPLEQPDAAEPDVAGPQEHEDGDQEGDAGATQEPDLGPEDVYGGRGEDLEPWEPPADAGGQGEDAGGQGEDVGTHGRPSDASPSDTPWEPGEQEEPPVDDGRALDMDG
jgi:hypothetical protein